MPMKTSVSRVLFSMIIIATSLQLLCAQNEGNTPQTIRDEDKQYITTGSVLIPAAVKDARQIIEAVDRWNAWMFAGMDGNGPAERFLLVYITGVGFPEPGAMNAFVEFRILRNLGKDKTPIPFILTRQYADNGDLAGITAVLAEKNAMMDSARYEITLSGSDTETEIAYAATVRLRGFFEFFVTLNSYTRTIEWYLEKIIGNFAYQILP